MEEGFSLSFLSLSRCSLDTRQNRVARARRKLHAFLIYLSRSRRATKLGLAGPDRKCGVQKGPAGAMGDRFGDSEPVRNVVRQFSWPVPPNAVDFHLRSVRGDGAAVYSGPR